MWPLWVLYLTRSESDAESSSSLKSVLCRACCEVDLVKANCTCGASDQELRQQLRPYWPGFNLCRNCGKTFVNDSRDPELPHTAPTPIDVIKYAYCLCGAKTKPSYRFCKICGRSIHMEPPPWWLKATWILMGID